MIKLIKLF